MGNQQLLLIVVGVIVVGVAIAVGMNYFRANAINTKRDLVINECINIATKAMAYYKMPTNFGGGGNKFTNWSISPYQILTESGTYSAQVFDDSIIVIGTGNEIVTGTDSIKIKVTVFPKYYRTEIIN
jgi:hypothetical protein